MFLHDEALPPPYTSLFHWDFSLDCELWLDYIKLLSWDTTNLILVLQPKSPRRRTIIIVIIVIITIIILMKHNLFVPARGPSQKTQPWCRSPRWESVHGQQLLDSCSRAYNITYMRISLEKEEMLIFWRTLLVAALVQEIQDQTSYRSNRKWSLCCRRLRLVWSSFGWHEVAGNLATACKTS